MNQGIQGYGHSFAGQDQKYKARYIKYTLKHPLHSSVHYSNYVSSFSTKPMIYLLRYISIMGYHTVNKNQVAKMFNTAQKGNSLEMISHFFNGKFEKAFHQIA